ncbi:MAG: hypothetical protein K0Q94_6678 [Paenibacillus sp.]|jgi:hypothetical protein|nr:hypothetical protein [Paenibacillus sp.]
MRLRQRDKRPVIFRPRITVKEPDATTYEGWGDPVTVYGHVQPAGGRLMAEIYGERLAYMQAMYVEGKPAISEGAGACLYTPDPDYRIVAIRPWSAHTVIDLEAIRP